ncbi:MAG: hypothetical protein KIT45_03810 [Fimbriimonadia bacterium]|nr:hypothetical protein [Fimbriimonadia bacterium]
MRRSQPQSIAPIGRINAISHLASMDSDAGLIFSFQTTRTRVNKTTHQAETPPRFFIMPTCCKENARAIAAANPSRRRSSKDAQRSPHRAKKKTPHAVKSAISQFVRRNPHACSPNSA